MIMQLSSRNTNLARYIVYNTDFCPVSIFKISNFTLIHLKEYFLFEFFKILATGLSGLYSELPQKLTQTERMEDIKYLNKQDIVNISSLNKFINSLEFCNNVIQVSPILEMSFYLSPITFKINFHYLKVSHSLIANQLLQYVYYGFLKKKN